jgi:hypothetical protein
MIEKWLQQNALWVIMDPWHPHCYEKDLVAHPNLTEENDIMVNKILNYIPNLKHVIVSMAEEKDGIKRTITPKLKHLYNIKDNPLLLISYLKKHNLQNIVYCGFHYGRCILCNKTGAKYMSIYYKTWIKKNLCGFFTCNKIQSIDDANQFTQPYATIF